MSRENFFITLTKITGKDKKTSPTFVSPSSIAFFEETPEGTVINFRSAESVLVSEKVEEIMRKGAAYGIVKVV